MLTLANGMRCTIASDPSLRRAECALTVGCGSLDDPDELEGLAHLAEHVTLATDRAGVQRFIDDRQGDINGYTAERTTTFYSQFDLSPGASALDEIREGCSRFGALYARALSPDTASAPAAVVAQELERVDLELQATLNLICLRLY